MSKILITGGAGMIGSNLAKKLIKEDNEVIIVDNLWRGKLEYLFDDNKPILDFKKYFFNRDLSIAGSCDDLLDGVDYVYHLADVVAGINYVFANQGSIFRKNILINSNVISSVRTLGNVVKGFIYVGTACSFPQARQNSFDVLPLKEEELYPADPETAYGWSKLIGQYETELLEKETSIPCSILMFHNVYGSPSDYGERSQVIPALVRKAIKYPDENFLVWGTGKQGRAFVHVRDVVNALILTKEKGLGKGVIQIGPSICTTIREIAEEIVRISGKDIKITFDINKPEGDKARSADYTKAKEVLAWEPKMSLEDGLRELYNWMSMKIMS